MNEVFISYKHFEDEEIESEAFGIAKELYEELSARNISAFFSDRTIYGMAVSDYKKAIDSALDSANVLVVVATDESHLQSGWVEYEYETFYEDILSHRKSNALICSYIKNIKQDQLPRSLARNQSYNIDKMSVEGMADYLEHFCVNNDGIIEGESNNIKTSNKASTEKHSKSRYSSDYKNELERLRIQAENSSEIDKEAINYIISQNLWDDEEIYVLDLGSAYGHVASDRFTNIENVKRIVCVDNNERVIERARVLNADNPKMVFEIIDIESEGFVEVIKQIMDKYDIPKFHIIFSALTLHHLKNPIKALRKIRNIMNDESRLIIRGSDDGSKLCHPSSDIMEEIIKKTTSVPGVSDRYNGRKIFFQLSTAGFKDIKIMSKMRSTSDLDYDERERLFKESFSYRTNYHEKIVEENPNDKKTIKELNELKELLDEFENNFFEVDFWYCEYDYLGIARRD